MKKKGLKLSADQLYDINKSSLKDAIVWFGGGCTGEVISPNGLVLTNHHCGYDYISNLSTSSDNILDNGFWAKNYQEERPVAGLTVAFVVKVDDITTEVLDAVQGLKSHLGNSVLVAAKKYNCNIKKKPGKSGFF